MKKRTRIDELRLKLLSKEKLSDLERGEIKWYLSSLIADPVLKRTMREQIANEMAAALVRNLSLH